MKTDNQRALRILCVEDNPLIAFHIGQLIEDLGHDLAGTLNSFADVQALAEVDADCALVDIDLVDGRTGPAAAKWLGERGVPSIFVTGQSDLARDHADVVVGILSKPVSLQDLHGALSAIS